MPPDCEECGSPLNPWPLDRKPLDSTLDTSTAHICENGHVYRVAGVGFEYMYCVDDDDDGPAPKHGGGGRV